MIQSYLVFQSEKICLFECDQKFCLATEEVIEMVPLCAMSVIFSFTNVLLIKYIFDSVTFAR